MKCIRSLVAATILGLAPTTAAMAADWRVERVIGAAWVATDAHPRQPLVADMELPWRSTVVTSQNGRVQLTDGKTAMTIAPNSIATVETRGLLFQTTRVAQQVGTIEFDVEKRRRPHFFVDTPYLAAVVKGTAFTVDVGRTTAAIGVNTGLVEVTDLETGQSANVGAGQSASSGEAEGGLSTAGPNTPSVSQGVASPPSVAPVGRNLAGFRAERAPAANPQTNSVDQSTTSSGAPGGDNGSPSDRDSGTGNDNGNGGAGGNGGDSGNRDGKGGDRGPGNGKGGGNGGGKGNGNAGANGNGDDKGGGNGDDKGGKGNGGGKEGKGDKGDKGGKGDKGDKGGKHDHDGKGGKGSGNGNGNGGNGNSGGNGHGGGNGNDDDGDGDDGDDGDSDSDDDGDDGDDGDDDGDDD